MSDAEAAGRAAAGADGAAPAPGLGPGPDPEAGPLLEVRDLKVHFRLPRRNLLTPGGTVHAVDGISFTVRRGSTFAIALPSL